MFGGSFMGGIADASKFESKRGKGRRFGLAWTPAQVHDGSIGRGGSEMMMSFATEEGRGYFIQAELAREHAADLAQRLEWAESKLHKIEEKRQKRSAARMAKLRLT
jgi:hypothetical protein